MNDSFENNEFFQQLPKETKEKLRNCKTEEEAMDVLKGDMIPIPDEALDGVAGGDGYAPCGGYGGCPLDIKCSQETCRKDAKSRPDL